MNLKLYKRSIVMNLCRLEDNVLEEESLRRLGNLTSMLEDAALFPFVDEDIVHEIREKMLTSKGISLVTGDRHHFQSCGVQAEASDWPRIWAKC